MRTFLFVLFTIAVGIVIQRGRLSQVSNFHTPVSAVKFSANNTIRPYYTTGPIRDVTLPKVTLLDRLSRKKFDNFVFNHYNQYRFEFTFADLGYASNFMFSFFTYGVEQYNIMQKIGFDLSESMLDGTLDLDIKKKNFHLTVRQYVDQQEGETITSFNLSLTRQKSNISANLTHVIRNKECFTSIRNDNIVSHKCFGGLGTGKVTLERILVEQGQKIKRSSVYNPTLNLTRAVYDGFRGSGMRWNWVWGIMNGFSKPEFYALNHTIPKQHWLGLNFGHIYGEGQDFAFIDGKIIPIEGLTYQFNDKMGINQNITFTATRPKLYANLTVVAVQHKDEDMGVLKLDMVKVQGNWQGWIERDDGKIYKFYEIAGFIERCNSIF